MSPPLTDPIQFRTSGVDACDHSECFLFSYDLHRYYRATEAERRPRILMNPAVRVAYEQRWYHWNNVILRRPFIRWWLCKLRFPSSDLDDAYQKTSGVTGSDMSYLTGRLSISDGVEIIVLGVGSTYLRRTNDVRH
jgi:hypothetical protein